MIHFAKEKQASAAIMQAMKSGNDAEIQKAWANFHDSVAEQVIADFKEVQGSADAAVLSQRGYRQLTSTESKWYQKLIGALKSSDPRQAFVSIVGGEDEESLMPVTIMDDVYRNLKQNHPLLSKISVTYTGYVTKWILSDATAQTAVWGQVTEEIAKEIQGAFRVVDVNQNKLSCYCFIEKSMLELGPTFLDGYIRTLLTESMANGLEYGVVKGSGFKEPTGLIRDIHEGVSFSSGYPEKSASNGKHTVTSFEPAEYGKLIANMAETEKGNKRTIAGVTLICNQVDYLTKIMPATTVKTADGRYANDLFPFPTEVIVSNALDDGKAILALLDEYKLFAGGEKNNVIEYSDDFKFLEDMRYFKVKQFATGQAFDNTSALLLDISNLEPGYVNVKVVNQAAAAASIPTV